MDTTKEFEGRITANDQSCKSAHQRIDSLEAEVKDIRRLTVAVERIAEKTEHIGEKVDHLSERVGSIERLPGKRWNDAMDTVIKLIIGGVVAYLLMRVGLGG